MNGMTLIRHLGLTTALALSASALAASGCTSLYATGTTNANAGTTSIQSVNPVTGTFTTQATLPAAITSLNGMSLDPVSGDLYYIDRTGGTVNTLYRFNPDTQANTQVAAVTLPAAGAVVIGATFDNTTTGSRLFVFYNNYQIQEVNQATGAVIRTLNLTLPATDTGGRTLQKTTTATSNTTTTSGDIIFIGGTLFGAIDGESTGTGAKGAVYYVNLGTPPTTGTTGTLTGSNAVRLNVGAAQPAPKSVNGISINPVNGLTYVTHTSGGNTLATLNTTTGDLTTLSTPGIITDLSDCNVLPDRPQLTKAFGAASVTQNSTGNVSLTITVGNTNPRSYYLQTALTDTLPSGMTVSTPSGASTTCFSAGGAAATLTATAGSGSVTLAADTRVPSGGCTVTLNVTPNTSTAGPITNTIAAGSLSSTAGSNPAAATATLTVNASVSGTLQKTQRNVTLGGAATTAPMNARPKDVIEYCLNATHNNGASATTATLRDALAAPLTAVPGAYGAGQDLKITRGAVVSYATFAADADAFTLTGQNLSGSLLPFSGGATVSICFQAKVS